MCSAMYALPSRSANRRFAETSGGEEAVKFCPRTSVSDGWRKLSHSGRVFSYRRTTRLEELSSTTTSPTAPSVCHSTPPS
uniref:Uncharacterized protein n=1 Tax=Zea mays TaxID=4577 RepID=B6SY21_MAIZE|nr:hypothetical protein [Zea mays]